MKRRPLAGLKAEALTTEPLPRLSIQFQPRFWGSQERRWELGKSHLAPEIMRGWDDADHYLCGLARNKQEGRHDGHLLPGDKIPGYVCKKCRQGALKRGYGARKEEQ